eukprot:m.64055 g.64055  ORF g.64055 m.64055 type:complete len:95 (-) comp11621_c0_seq2:64-348(-)
MLLIATSMFINHYVVFDGYYLLLQNCKQQTIITNNNTKITTLKLYASSFIERRSHVIHVIHECSSYISHVVFVISYRTYEIMLFMHVIKFNDSK